MPTFNITTKQSKRVWGSPDGKIEIFEVVVDVNGQELGAKTYSKEIAVEGWTGEIETYEKAGRNGVETFLKQPQKENTAGGYTNSEKSNYTPRDDSHIKAQWAIGQAVAMINDPSKLGDIQALATDLFAMVDVVKNGLDTVVPVTGDETQEEIGQLIDKAEMDRVLGKTEEVDLEQTELPWPKK